MTSAGRLAIDATNTIISPHAACSRPSRPEGAGSPRSQPSATAGGGQAANSRLAGVFEVVGLISMVPGSSTGASVASGIPPFGCSGSVCALATGNPRIADAAARDLEHVGLADALELCLLYRDDPERYERAAARWIGRLVAERPRLRLSEVELAVGAFREALHSDRGVTTLREKVL